MAARLIARIMQANNLSEDLTMSLNKHPLREITQQDIDDYNRDGVVCLRKVLDPDWIKLLEPIAREVIIDKKDVGLLPTIPGRYMARCIYLRIPNCRGCRKGHAVEGNSFLLR